MGVISKRGGSFFTLSTVLIVAAVLAGCVYPKPPPGQPTPSLSLAISAPTAGEAVVTATPTNFTPTSVSFHLDVIGTPFGVDTTAPFEATLTTTGLTSGTHRVYAIGTDPKYGVYQFIEVNFDSQRPNVVMILLDDLDQTTTPYWDAMPQTKALLADQGLVFDNAFVTDPVCCPSRATLLTGDYPHNTGVFDNSAPDGGYGGFTARAQSDTIATRLKAAGYATGYLGKYLNGYTGTAVPPGWDEFWGVGGFMYYGVDYTANHNGMLEYHGFDEDDYMTDVISRHALDFVGASETNDAQPFFLYLTPTAPHYPLGPPQRYASHPILDAELPARPNRNEADLSDKPTWLRDGYPLISQSDLDWHEDLYGWAQGSLLAVDDLVVSLTQDLEAKGELDNTVFVFMSDNGYTLDAHRLPQKMAPYEESIRVPLVMKGPGIPTGTEDRYVLNNDIAPTIMQLAGAGEQSDMDGRSLVPLLRGDATSWRNDFLVEYRGTGSGRAKLNTLADVQTAIATYGSIVDVPTYRGLRSQQWLYVEWYAGSTHEYELYDMAADPYQLDNLIATPQGAQQYASVTASLRTRLVALATCTAASCRS